MEENYRKIQILTYQFPVGQSQSSSLVIFTFTPLFLMHPFSTPRKHEKTEGFLMFSGGRERVHWKQMG